MIRILQVVNDMHRAGLETMLMNYYRNIDRTQIQFDFLTHRPNKSDYDDEIVSMGGKVYYAPRLYPQNYFKYFRWMKRFFNEHTEYEIVHSHIDSMSFFPLKAAKKAGVPIRIAHSHNTAFDKDFKYILKEYFRLRINSVATNRLACGKKAGEFLFGKKEFKVIPNAVESKKFLYNEDIRIAKRKELGIIDEFVIGHVGRFSYQKNHKFLICIFNELQKKDNEVVLLLVGVGDKETEVRRQVQEFGIEDKVKFLGNRSDVSDLYQVMDVFVLPSHFEGIPVVGVEAQFADLPCFFSDRTPKEVAFNPKTQFIALNTKADYWAEEILKLKGMSIRSNTIKDITDNRYDIGVACSILEKYYRDLIKKKKNS